MAMDIEEKTKLLLEHEDKIKAMVYSICYHREKLEDCYQIGRIAFCRACDTYDKSKAELIWWYAASFVRFAVRYYLKRYRFSNLTIKSEHNRVVLETKTLDWEDNDLASESALAVSPNFDFVSAESQEYLLRTIADRADMIQNPHHRRYCQDMINNRPQKYWEKYKAIAVLQDLCKDLLPYYSPV